MQFNNLFCANVGLIFCYILDVVLVILILCTLYIMFFKPSKNKSKTPTESSANSNASKNNSTSNTDSPVIPLDNTLVEKPDPAYVLLEDGYKLIDNEKIKSNPQPIKKPETIHIIDVNNQNFNNVKKEDLSQQTKPKRLVKDEVINITDKKQPKCKISSYSATTNLINTLKEEQPTFEAKISKSTKKNETK